MRKPRTWNDVLSVAVIIGLPLFWYLLLMAQFAGSDIVIGTTLGGWTLVVQFYFRKDRGETAQAG